MQLFKLEDKCVLNTTLEKAWDFFQDPHNLKLITPPELNLVVTLVVTSDTGSVMYPGIIVTYKVQILPFIFVDWITEITHINPPKMFVDEQRFGPYKMWHHEHHLRQVPNGIENHDIIHYVITGWPIDGLLNRFIVRPRLDKIFEYRKKKLLELFR